LNICWDIDITARIFRICVNGNPGTAGNLLDKLSLISDFSRAILENGMGGGNGIDGIIHKRPALLSLVVCKTNMGI